MLQSEEILSDDMVLGLSQKELGMKIEETLHNNLLNGAETSRDKARLQSLQLPHAGDWLHVIPSPSLGLLMRPPEFRVSVLYRLGMPVFAGDGPCIACGQFSDSLGDHAVGCASQGERIARPNHLWDALYSTAQSAQLADALLHTLGGRGLASSHRCMCCVQLTVSVG